MSDHKFSKSRAEFAYQRYAWHRGQTKREIRNYRFAKRAWSRACRRFNRTMCATWEM